MEIFSHIFFDYLRLETNTFLLLRDFDGLDVGRGDGKERLHTSGCLDLHATLGMGKVDIFQQIGNETGIAPILGVANTICLGEYGALFL